MKPQMKIEGDVLKIEIAQSVEVDTDKDGQAAVKGSLSLALEVDGSEVLMELLKSAKLADKAKAILGINVE